MPKMNPTREDTLRSLKAEYHAARLAVEETRRQVVQYALICVEKGESPDKVQDVIGPDHNLPALIDQENRRRAFQRRKKDQQ